MTRTLYHGTSVEFDGNNIDLNASSRPKDFGNGFYLTSIYEQARKWSKRSRQILNNKNSIIKEYIYKEKESFETLNILILNEYNKEWLDYILKNRNKINDCEDNYDIVIGLMADGKIKQLMRDYISDFITEDELLEELQFEYKTDQYTFKTKNSLNMLTFIKDNYDKDGSGSYGK